MYSFGGQPFINVRNSFQSFIPCNIPTKLTNDLLNHWITYLKNNPHLHDKLNLSRHNKLDFWFWFKNKQLLPKHFKQNDIDLIRKEYFEITKNAVEQNTNSIQSNIEILNDLLEEHNRSLENLNKGNHLETISKIIENIKEKGTTPFSILARHAFIGKALLKSLVNIKILKENEKKELERSVSTITSEFLFDLDLLSMDKLSLDEFLKKYGHLRPGLMIYCLVAMIKVIYSS